MHSSIGKCSLVGRKVLLRRCRGEGIRPPCLPDGAAPWLLPQTVDESDDAGVDARVGGAQPDGGSGRRLLRAGHRRLHRVHPAVLQVVDVDDDVGDGGGGGGGTGDTTQPERAEEAVGLARDHLEPGGGHQPLPRRLVAERAEGARVEVRRAAQVVHEAVEDERDEEVRRRLVDEDEAVVARAASQRGERRGNVRLPAQPAARHHQVGGGAPCRAHDADLQPRRVRRRLARHQAVLEPHARLRAELRHRVSVDAAAALLHHAQRGTRVPHTVLQHDVEARLEARRLQATRQQRVRSELRPARLQQVADLRDEVGAVGRRLEHLPERGEQTELRALVGALATPAHPALRTARLLQRRLQEGGVWQALRHPVAEQAVEAARDARPARRRVPPYRLLILLAHRPSLQVRHKDELLEHRRRLLLAERRERRVQPQQLHATRHAQVNHPVDHDVHACNATHAVREAGGGRRQQAGASGRTRGQTGASGSTSGQTGAS